MITTIYSFGAKTGSAPGRQIDGSSTYRWASKFDTGGKQVTVQSLHARFLAPSSAKVRLALYRSAGNWPGELIDVTQEKVGVPAGNVEFLFDKWGSNPLSGGGWLLQGTFWLAVIADGPVLIGTEPIQSGTQNQLQTVYGTSQYSWGADPFGSGSPDSVTGFDAVRIAVSAWAWAPYVSPPMPSADQADFAAAVAPISVEAGAGSSSNITVSQYNGFKGLVTFEIRGTLPIGLYLWVEPSTVDLPGGADTTRSATLRAIAEGSAPMATATLTLRCASNGFTRDTPISVTVTRVGSPPPPAVGDFALIAVTPTVYVERGKTGEGVNLHLAAFGGINTAVGTFQVTGLPTGVTFAGASADPFYLDAADSNATGNDGYARSFWVNFNVAANAPFAQEVAVTIRATRTDTGATQACVVLMTVGPAIPTVRFGANDATNVVVIDENTVEVDAPAHKDSYGQPAPGAVSLRIIDGVSGFDKTTQNAYTYDAEPLTITGASPTTVAVDGGTVVYVVGTGFRGPLRVSLDNPTYGYDYVTDAISDVIVSEDGTEMWVTLPAHVAGAVSLDIWRIDNAHAGTGLTYGVLDAFRVEGVAPNYTHLSGGVACVVNGAGFAAGATVLVGGVAVPTTYVTAAQLAFTTPSRSSAGAVDVSVRNPDGALRTLVGGLTYESLVVTSISPVSLTTLGGSLTVNGRWFTTQHAIKILDQYFPTTRISDTQLRASVGGLAPGRYDVSVQAVTPTYGEIATLLQALLVVLPSSAGDSVILFIIT